MRYMIVFILFLSSVSLAQETRNTEQDQPQPEVASGSGDGIRPSSDKSDAAPTQSDIDGGSRENGFEIFRPTEDISEDLAVPFPVDI